MISALIDHLWQSSLFTLCALLVAVQLRKCGAHLRYWIWFAASVKFLLPFSLLVVAGSWLSHHTISIAEQVRITQIVHQIAAPLVTPAAFFVPAKDTGGTWMYVVLLLWAIGCLGLIIRWLIHWLRIKGAVRAATPTAIVESVPVMTSSTLHEPGVAGIVRPVLLLPEGITTRLTSQQLQAVLDHELCHVRRRDNLTAAIHMLVESVLWFHPLVWWIGARLIDERERACDEAVVRSGNEPKIYAEGILKVCQFYLASKLTCVAGVSGADLKMRLEVIMRNDVVTQLSNSKRFLLSIMALATFAAPIFVGLTASEQSYARTPDAKTASTVTATAVGKIEMLDGKRLNLNFHDVEMRSLLKALAEAAQVNILVSDKVSGTISVRLEEMAWDRALDIILVANGLTRHDKDGIIFIDALSDTTGT